MYDPSITSAASIKAEERRTLKDRAEQGIYDAKRHFRVRNEVFSPPSSVVGDHGNARSAQFRAKRHLPGRLCGSVE